jgi:hypothetical protein
MMFRTRSFTMLMACGAVGLLAACSDSTGSGSNATTLTAVSPAGSATDVNDASSVVLTFSAPMGQGMESYMDVHVGTTADSTMPMSCTWSADRTTLTCTHTTPFAHGGTYTIHVGDGMMDADGQPVGMGNMMSQMGGQWLTSGMMGGMHAGQPMGMMGQGWKGSNGSYGMIFTFTAA